MKPTWLRRLLCRHTWGAEQQINASAVDFALLLGEIRMRQQCTKYGHVRTWWADW